jgi:hypothetical protein
MLESHHQTAAQLLGLVAGVRAEEMTQEAVLRGQRLIEGSASLAAFCLMVRPRHAAPLRDIGRRRRAAGNRSNPT